MSGRAVIRKIEAFEKLSEQERNKLSSLYFEVRDIARKRDIVSEGDLPTHVRVILDGWAARYFLNRDGGRRITGFLLPGDFCDIHITSLDVMDHGITALTACRVGIIEKIAIDQITRSTPALTLAFWRSTLVDEAILRQWLVSAGRRSAYQNIAHLLCELHARLELIGLAGNGSFVAPLTQEDIGDATGLTSVHVSRMLRELREKGVAEFAGINVIIKDVAALRREADFNPTYLHLRTERPPT